MREHSKCDEYIFGGISALICLVCLILAFGLVYGIAAVMMMSVFASPCRTRLRQNPRWFQFCKWTSLLHNCTESENPAQRPHSVITELLYNALPPERARISFQASGKKVHRCTLIKMHKNFATLGWLEDIFFSCIFFPLYYIYFQSLASRGNFFKKINLQKDAENAGTLFWHFLTAV